MYTHIKLCVCVCVCVTSIFVVYSAISLRGATCRSFDLVCLISHCQVTLITHRDLIGIIGLTRDYLSPIDLIRNYPHLVVLGTGLAFGFLVVRILVLKFVFVVK